MATITPVPPPIQTPESEPMDEEVSVPEQQIPVSGRLHAFDRDYVQALPIGLRVTSMIVNLLFFSVFAVLWLAFGTFLLFDQSALDPV